MTVEVVNRPSSYVATALNGRRRLRSLINRDLENKSGRSMKIRYKDYDSLANPEVTEERCGLFLV